jgi:hypothetical protein
MPAKPSHQARLLAAAKTLFSQVVYPFKRQVAQPGALPSALPGMGAVLHPAGASFRVWAPNADQVYVCGSFNGWSREANPLAPEGNGYWSADVAGVTAGASYKYRIVNQIGETAFDVLRVDPYARLVTSSIGDSVVHDTTFVWDDDDYRTPPWNEMVIYEMHIGTFTAAPAIWIYGSSTAGAKRGTGASISTTIGGRIRHGGILAPTTVARKCASSSVTMRSIGSRSSILTGCALTPLPISAMLQAARMRATI